MTLIQSSQVSRIAYEGGGYRWGLFRITGLTSASTYDATTSFSKPITAVYMVPGFATTLGVSSSGIDFASATTASGLGFVMIQGEAPAN